jgi:hypothetical protein
MIGVPPVGITRRAVLAAVSAFAIAAMVRPWQAMAQTMDGGKMPVGVIGSGKIGGTVGRLWIKAGHPVLFSSRHPEELASMVKDLGPLAKAGTVAQAIAFSDVLLLAIPYGAYPAFGKEYDVSLKGKIVLDAGNASAGRDGAAIAAEVEKNGIGVTSQKYLPDARLVRAFNTLGYTILAREANRPPPRLGIPIAGDDAAALRIAAGLARDAGFDPVVVGNLDGARKIQRGNPGYGQAVSAAELKQKLGLAP